MTMVNSMHVEKEARLVEDFYAQKVNEINIHTEASRKMIADFYSQYESIINRYIIDSLSECNKMWWGVILTISNGRILRYRISNESEQLSRHNGNKDMVAICKIKYNYNSESPSKFIEWYCPKK